jgi:adenylosuccinate synthase
MTGLVLTKLDVLSGQQTLRVCTGYRGEDGVEFDHFPYHQSVLHHSTGSYVELPGWSEDVTDCRTMDELPNEAREYISFVEDFIGVPVVLIGVGPARDQIIWTEASEGTIPRR